MIELNVNPLSIVFLFALIGFGIAIGVLIAISFGILISELVSAVVSWLKTPTTKRRRRKAKKEIEQEKGTKV